MSYTIFKDCDTDFKDQGFLRYHIKTTLTLTNCVAQLYINCELLSTQTYNLTSETGGYYFDIKISAADTENLPIGDCCGTVKLKETVTSGETTSYRYYPVKGKIPFTVKYGSC